MVHSESGGMAGLRDLSRRDPDRVVTFVEGPGAGLAKWARKEALRIIQP
jgi:hypothetical protein